ncbi:MAG: parallel beta-helix repeat protein, partial [Bradymonadia bacterium]
MIHHRVVAVALISTLMGCEEPRNTPAQRPVAAPASTALSGRSAPPDLAPADVTSAIPDTAPTSALSEPPASPASAAPASQALDVPRLPEPNIKMPKPGQVHRVGKGGEFANIADALAAAAAGDEIRVMPGVYTEPLLIKRAVSIVGEGPIAEIRIRVADVAALVFDADQGRIADLTIEQTGGNAYGVDIMRGRLLMERVHIQARDLAGIGIRGDADPLIRHCRVHHTGQAGVLIAGKQARGAIVDTEISAAGKACVEVADGADPLLRRNRLHHCKASGVFVHSRGRGTYEDNEIEGNALAGIEVKARSSPIVRGNRIHGGKE